MITGCHVMVFTRDADADRAFLRDILKLPSVDAGEGWLIFALPPGEVAFHPADKNNFHELYFMCENLAGSIEELETRGVICEAPAEQSWGITTAIPLPGGGHIKLYQPKHPSPLGNDGRH